MAHLTGVVGRVHRARSIRRAGEPDIRQMKTLRRIDLRERLYFLAVVTDGRREILLRDLAVFWQSWGDLKLDAWVVLPEHFHAILANGEKSISEILHRFKRKYSTRYSYKYGSGRVWQNRFWDHIIRNERDYWSHLTYIHLNPVKHGLAINPFDYPHSSIEKFRDYYSDLEKVEFDNASGDFGE